MQKQKVITWNAIGSPANPNLPPKDSDSDYSIEVFVTDGVNFSKSKIFYFPNGAWDIMGFTPTHWSFIDFLP
jgi:hypothetical protein